ncbi:MAG: hypothetical protein WCY16_09050 [Weeksellaceae bacterium]
MSRSIFWEIKKIKEKAVKNIFGVAGGASGGDIIFHEQCRKLDIKTGLFLPLPVEEYKKRSVADSGGDWIRRFNLLYSSLPVFFMPKNFEPFANSEEKLNVWQKNNLWQLDFCFQNGSENISLLALWDGKRADGSGGTEDMVNKIMAAGGEVKQIDPNSLGFL